MHKAQNSTPFSFSYAEQRQRACFCHHCSRILVVLLTAIGVFSSGLFANLILMLAVVIWLWLPEFDAWFMQSYCSAVIWLFIQRH